MVQRIAYFGEQEEHLCRESTFAGTAPAPVAFGLRPSVTSDRLRLRALLSATTAAYTQLGVESVYKELCGLLRSLLPQAKGLLATSFKAIYILSKSMLYAIDSRCIR
jgi:hypothetical protein